MGNVLAHNEQLVAQHEVLHQTYAHLRDSKKRTEKEKDARFESILVPGVACQMHMSNAREPVLAYLAEPDVIILHF